MTAHEMVDSDSEMAQTNGASSRTRVAGDAVVAEASLKELQNALYASCASQPAEKIFDQHDLLALGVIPKDDLGLLLSCTRQLTKEGLLKVMTKNGAACWRVVKKEDAAK